MTPESFIHQITSYFASNTKYKSEIIAEITRIVSRIGDTELESVYDRLLEDNAPSFMVGIKQIVEACEALGISYHKAHFVPAKDWQCVSCDHKFKYAIAPSEDDRIDKGIYDFCPNCGFQPYWMKLESMYRGQGISTEWYDRLVMDHQGFGLGKSESKVRKGNGMTLTRGGVFWDKSKAEQERRDNKKLDIQTKIAEIDRSLKWKSAEARKPYAD